MTISNPPIDPPVNGRDVCKSFAEVEEQLIDAMRLWFRSPGGGRFPFAKDGPWHLARPDVESAVELAELVLNAEKMGRSPPDPPRPLPLSMAEVERRDRVSEWIRFAPERDRRLVALVITWQSRTDKPVRWARIRDQMIRSGEPAISARGLGMRYSRAITSIARSLRMAEIRPVGVSSQLVRADENKGCSPTAT